MSDQQLTYQQALEYLDSLVDYSLMRNLRFSEEKFNLGRMQELLARIGNPHLRYPVVHVAGTKGKGSTCAFIAGGLQAAGYRVGLYTSPHLLEYTERIQINRQMIRQDELAQLLIELKPVAEDIGMITKYELTTAVAFEYFARQQVDAAVIEVGLGGRLDATNVVQPVCSVITSLSYDHMNVLGHTLAAIAGEKAGIIKAGRPVVISPQKPEALDVVLETAAQRQSKVTLVGRDVFYVGGERDLQGQDILLWNAEEQPFFDQYVEGQGDSWRPRQFRIPLLGQHQIQNAATAYAALQVIHENGLPVTDDDVSRGFKNTSWPGRFEIVHKRPYVVFDSAHNRDSALRLHNTLQDTFPNQKVVMLFGVSEDKDVAGMFEELMPGISMLVAAQAASQRAMSAEKLIQLAHRFGRRATTGKDVKDSLAKAYKTCGQDDVLLITGSMFLVAEARIAWDKFASEEKL